MVNKICSIYREKKEVKKKKGFNGHMTVGKGGEIENITVGKWDRGCSTNGHMTVVKKGGEGVGSWAEPWALKFS